MTTDEATLVLLACDKADGGCWYCLKYILTDLRKRLPEVPWRAALDAACVGLGGLGYNAGELWEESKP